MKQAKARLRTLRTRKPPVTDPLRDAETRYGIPFLLKREVSPWQQEIARHTTREFSRVGKGFQRHCGPTAITNLILTLHRRYRYLQEPVVPREVFAAVSEIGRKKGIYWNTDLLHLFGGTYDVLTRRYICACLRRFGLSPVARTEEAGGEDGPHRVRVGSTFFASSRRALQALDNGSLLYLQLTHHPVYGSHHLLGCGYVTLQSVDGKHKEIYLILADGWDARPRYLRLRGLGIWHFLEID